MTLRSLRGDSPSVHPGAWVAPTALLTGDVTVADGAAVLDGAVVTAESAPVRIGPETVVMENAVVRGAGTHPTVIGARTMIGPGTHVTGAVIGDECMVATHATVFNGARVGHGSMIGIGAIVHVGTRLPENSRVPMQHIAVGDPATVHPPHEAPAAHQEVERIGFTREVFDHDTADLDFRQTISWLTTTYSAALRRGAATIGEEQT